VIFLKLSENILAPNNYCNISFYITVIPFSVKQKIFGWTIRWIYYNIFQKSIWYLL